jgi:hypothetical protein
VAQLLSECTFHIHFPTEAFGAVDFDESNGTWWYDYSVLCPQGESSRGQSVDIWQDGETFLKQA